MTLLIVMFLLAVVIGIVVLAGHLDRKGHDIERRSEEHVRKRLSRRERMHLQELIDRKSTDERYRPGAEKLLATVAKVIGVEVELLRPDDKLVGLLSVRPDELETDERELWDKAKRGDWILAFIDDIHYELEKEYTEQEWKRALEALPQELRPRNDDDWIVLYLPMTLSELALLFEGQGFPDRLTFDLCGVQPSMS